MVGIVSRYAFVCLLAVSLASSLGACAKPHAQPHDPELEFVTGVKHPNSQAEGPDAVTTEALTLSATARPKGFTELVPFALPSPDQTDAGSCLYMTLTGITEWFLARANPAVSRASDGPLDLSERYVMNLSGDSNKAISDWKTDSVYFLNSAGKLPLNRDYRFTKGWSVVNSDGERVAARKSTAGATYDTYFNWVDDRDKIKTSQFVSIPKLKRTILWADPEGNQWNTGIMPESMVGKIKAALRENKAPVQVLYNHFGYWHSHFIVGYDDERSNENCKFVTDFLSYMNKRGSQLRSDADGTSGDERENLLGQASGADKAAKKTKIAFDNGGGCHPKGVFYVRDSIYGSQSEPWYDYDLKNDGEEERYSKTIVLLEYDYLRTMANHAILFTEAQ